MVTLSRCCNVTVEQRTYAHRGRLALLVTDFVVTMNGSSCPSTHTVQLAAGAGASPTAAGRQDFSWKSTVEGATTGPGGAQGGAGASVFVGTTLLAERRGRRITAAIATLAPLTGVVNRTVAVGQRQVFSFPSAFVSDVDAEQGGGSAAALAANATAVLQAAALPGPDDLFAEHVAAVAAEHSRVGIAVHGNLPLARVINVTMYSLRTALSADVSWSTAPGGLSTGGRWTADGHDTHGGGGYPEGGSSYYGHVFWDVRCGRLQLCASPCKAHGALT
eukprot:SAG25_NODE_810_length_5237_cov_5.091086_4_plen_276_part_00